MNICKKNKIIMYVWKEIETNNIFTSEKEKYRNKLELLIMRKAIICNYHDEMSKIARVSDYHYYARTI